MAKPLKIILIVVGIFFALVVVGIATAALLFDPNQYSGQIAEQVKKENGRDLTLGHLELKVFPWLAVGAQNVKLGNAPGFGAEPFAELGEARVGVKLLPLLFSRRVELSTLTVKGLKLNLAVDKTGKNNWDDLSKKEEAPAAPVAETEQGGVQFKLEDLDIGGLEIVDGALRYSDAKAGKSYALDKLSLKTGKVKYGEPLDVKFGVTLVSTEPAINADVTLDGKLKWDLKSSLYGVEDLVLKLAASGKGVPGGKQDVKLTGAANYDGAKGSFQLSNALLEAAGVKLSTSITGEGLAGDAPKLSGPISIAQFNPREVLGNLGQKIEAADKDALKTASFSAKLNGSFKSAGLSEVALKLDQTTAKGRIDVRDFATQAIQFALEVDQLDVDRYLPPKKAAAKAAGADKGSGKSDVNSIEIPAETLNNLNAEGTLDIAQLKINGIKLSGVRLKLAGGKGVVKSQDLSAKLYGGGIALNNRFTPGSKPQYAVKTQLNALNAGPFLQDFVGKDYVNGLANLNLNVSSAGLTVGDMRKALNGDLDVKVENGAVKGFNLAQIIRKGQAALAGNLNYTEDAPKQTDFSAMSVSGKIINGILKSDTLNAASPMFRLGGAGQIDLVNETIDYLAKPTIVETSTGQGGKDLENLKGLVIPIRLSGNLFSPSYKVDLNEALKQKALERVNQQVDTHRDELKQKLNDRINKWLQPKKQEPAAPPAKP